MKHKRYKNLCLNVPNLKKKICLNYKKTDFDDFSIVKVYVLSVYTKTGFQFRQRVRYVQCTSNFKVDLHIIISYFEGLAIVCEGGSSISTPRPCIIYRVSQKRSFNDFQERLGHIFQTPFFNQKLQLTSMSFQKVISILSHIAKKLQVRQFSKNCLSEKNTWL